MTTVMVPIQEKIKLKPDSIGILLAPAAHEYTGMIPITHMFPPDMEFQYIPMMNTTNVESLLDAGQKIAVLLLFPKMADSQVFLTQQITLERPQLTVIIEGRRCTGLMDTGADCTVFPLEQWNSAWPLGQAQNLYGRRGVRAAVEAKRPLRWEFAGKTGKVWPHVLPGLPIILWGRDLLSQIGLTISTIENF